MNANVQSCTTKSSLNIASILTDVRVIIGDPEKDNEIFDIYWFNLLCFLIPVILKIDH